MQINHVARHPRKFLSAFTTLLLLNFILALHHASITYTNSSLLGQFMSPEGVSLLYVIASIIVVGVLALGPQLVHTVGVLRLFILSIIILQISIFFLGFSKNIWSAAAFFILQAVFMFILRYLLDLYLESLSKDESKTGNTRSLFITGGSLGWLLGPVIASVLIVGSFFGPLYAFSALILTPAFLIAMTTLKRFTPSIPKTPRIIDGFKKILYYRKNVRAVMFVHLLMHLFNVIIIIYAPLYLFEVGGYSWQAIGSLIALAMLPYLIIEIPLGFFADHSIGEKEIMVGGLAILGITTALLSFVPLTLFFTWSLLFIATRIGGAMLEIGTESYFFKQVNEQDTEIISIFRILWPLGGVIAPLIALLVLPLVGLGNIFAVFGVIFLMGIPVALKIVDTR